MSLPTLRLALCLPLLAAMAGCGPDTARNFGFTREAPDEFQVTTRAPLSMPPSLGELPVPRPGAERPQELSQRQAAEAALVPGAALSGPATGPRSSGEAALLAQTGRPVSDDIRRRVDEESLRLDQPERGLADRLIFWRQSEPPGTALDASREARRLRENAALGRDVTEGETPVIQRSQSGNPVRRLLESIF
ncbi:DUF3035 domain-containing protein [Siccirubricoccus sp. KC 17139]|uniref:DUF3035 domain-containing protein n=1 Tax=Siccirubricoccus soli TaxID=2899147 RepID=A0ABT1CY21_9PROT|nr:DUF3035 domain-containing protein [Siccirubricoccus soli]MCO6414568.1 DUF3035 domain-containing protein [Siccirubricoccus soli]MCP2680698.1 DUF3035 domain-containing protein [Siccirubricoccus soli]